MDRRDFLRQTALAPTLAPLLGAGLGLLGAGGLSQAAQAAHHEGAGHDGSATAKALAGLHQALADVEAGFSAPAWRLQTPGDFVEARRYLLHTLQHGLEVFLEGDAARPAFKRFVTPEKKLLGDNPDAVYFHALVDPAHAYRIRGNTADATYTSFTVELGTGDGGNSTGVGSTRNDTEFDVAPDGSFEIIASARKPGATKAGNWLELPAGAGSLSTRHYYEREHSIAADRLHHIPLVIEALENPGAPPPPNDATVARGIERISHFLRTAIQPPQAQSDAPQWVSTVPNQLPAPKRTGNDNDAVGFAAVDNVYSMAPFLVKPGEALVIRGRWPKARFGNVVLWNRFVQTLDYEHRRTSLNRKQTKLEADGSFKMVLAASDPGVPNWLDTEGRAFGSMFWRFQLPEEDIEPLRTQLVPLAAAASA